MLPTRLLLGCCLSLLTIITAQAQTATPPPHRPQGPQLPLPQASPRTVLQQTIGLTDIIVDDHAPGVKNRQIWGKLVPYDEIWRAGANENTLLTFSDSVKLNGRPVPPGQYSFYVIPHEGRDWELVLNRKTDHWGAEGYDPKNDLVRLPARSEEALFHETLLYWFSDLKLSNGRLNLTWEKHTVRMFIETNVQPKALAGIKETITQNPGNWELLAQAADYMVQNRLEPELALRYINESIRLRDLYSNNWIKARLMASQQDYTTAIAFARKAIKMGNKSDDTFKSHLPAMRIQLTEWQGKAY